MKKIPLSKNSKKNKGKYFALVDNHNFKWLNQWNWSLSTGRGDKLYAMRVEIKDGVRKPILMHKLILKTPPNKLSDHEDGNGLNNQEYNLRIANSSQNNANRRKRDNTSCIYKGVAFHKRDKCFNAYVSKNNKSFFLGKFDSRHEAAIVRDIASIIINGEFSNLNFPNSQTNKIFKTFKP